MKLVSLFCLSVLAALSIVPQAHSQIVQCTDAKGAITFQESPCKAGHRERLLKSAAQDKPISSTPININSKNLIGTWCFYEQSYKGADTVDERVTIQLNRDGSYRWSEARWKQTGTWSLKDSILRMSLVGRHEINRLSKNHIYMTRITQMKWRRGRC